MRVLGARLQIVASDGGRMTESLTREMIEAARVIARDTGAFWATR
jgi:cysteine synthase A